MGHNQIVSHDNLEQQSERTKTRFAVDGDVRVVENLKVAPNETHSVNVLFWQRRGMRTTRKYIGGNLDRPLPDTP